jgi:TRAP-type uncharacterized transport system substrate-binding protein
MNRRSALRCAVAGGLWLALSGHSPYRQWDVYRKTRLVVLVSAAEQPSVILGSVLATIYGQQLPDSRATVARARDTNDLLRLIASRQLEVALLREPDAYAALAGEPPHADGGKVPLRALAVLGDYVFVCREDLPNPSAYMLVEVLAKRWRDFDPALVRTAAGPMPAGRLRVPLHPGAIEYYRDHPAEPRGPK